MVASPARPLLCTLLLTAANLLIPLSIIVFATGFFPYKPFLPGLAQYEPLEYGVLPSAPFDKLVFMVVDALRRSAMFQCSMLFSQANMRVSVTLSTRTTRALHSHRGWWQSHTQALKSCSHPQSYPRWQSHTLHSQRPLSHCDNA